MGDRGARLFALIRAGGLLAALLTAFPAGPDKKGRRVTAAPALDADSQRLLGLVLDLLPATFDVFAGTFHGVATGSHGGDRQHQRKPNSMGHFFLLRGIRWT